MQGQRSARVSSRTPRQRDAGAALHAPPLINRQNAFASSSHLAPHLFNLEPVPLPPPSRPPNTPTMATSPFRLPSDEELSDEDNHPDHKQWWEQPTRRPRPK